MRGKAWLTFVVTLVSLGPWQPSAPVTADWCVTVGVGEWLPRPAGAIWSTSRELILTNKLDPYVPNFDGRHGWRVVEFRVLHGQSKVPARSSEYDWGWVWLTPTPDSLLLVRPAMLSEGMEVRGAWTADTLRGRAHAYSDAIGMVNGIAHSPRANAYGRRYACQNPAAAAEALATVEQLRLADRPDAGLTAREDSAWTGELLRQLQQH